MGAFVLHARVLNDNRSIQHHWMVSIFWYLHWSNMCYRIMDCLRWQCLPSSILWLDHGPLDCLHHSGAGERAYGTIYHADLQPFGALRIFIVSQGS